MKNKVGLIGVGAMGSALLSRLRSNGCDVFAYDVADRGKQAAVEGGAILKDSPALVAVCTKTIHVFVNTDEQVLDVVLSESGLLAGATAGSMLLLHSTTLPRTTLRVAHEAAKRDVMVLDAPITAIPRRLLAGEGIALVGGPTPQVETIRPYLAALGLDVRHFGELGSGNAAKLAKNFANAAERLVLIAAVELAKSARLDATQFLEMMNAADYGSLITRWRDVFQIAKGVAEPKQVTDLFNKDIILAAEFGEEWQLKAPMLAAARDAAKIVLAEWASRGQCPTSG